MSTETALVDDVVAAVDVKGFPGDETGGVMRQEGGGNADVVDADQAAGGRLGFRLVEQRVELGNPRGGPRGERPGRDGVHANALRAELGGEIAHRALERGL